VQADRTLSYEKLSDPILVTRAKHGDRRALEVLLQRHAPKVERLALHVLRDPDDARDASQEAMAKVCLRLKQFRGDSQFSTWLHRLVLNTCRDAYARRRVHEPLADDLQAAHDVSELARELRESLNTVPEQQARVVLLKHAVGLSFEEIAAADGVPVGTAKCQAHRGRARLRERLSA
jgi:RNA polymerase sigma-70 factor (ECF subfamily)